MRRTLATRRLRLLATALLVALAFAAGSVVAALGDDALTYYACASPSGSLGQIRVGTAPNCGPNATLVSWESGSTPQTVSWNDLADIPAEIENRVAADVVCTDAAGCVDGGEIVDASITSDDLGPDSVTSAKILDGTVSQGDLGTGSVGTDELAPDSVISDRILNGTVLQEDLGTDSVGSAQLQSGSVRGGHDGTVENEILDGSVTGDDLADGSVGNSQIQVGAVTSSHVRANAAMGSTIELTAEPGVSVIPSVAILTLPDNDTEHLVQVYAQAMLQIQGALTTDSANVTVSLLDESLELVSTLDLSLQGSEVRPVTISGLDQELVSPGSDTARRYRLLVTVHSDATANVNLTRPSIYAIDLGTTGP